MVGGHDDLGSFMKANFDMMYHHKFSLTEIESMMPFERDVYIALLSAQIQKEEENKNNE